MPGSGSQSTHTPLVSPPQNMNSNEPYQIGWPVVPKIHGLIIGVNKYARPDIHPDLLGCVGDAKSMLKYFTNLGVPEERFLCLYNEHATREAILSAFVNHLINNTDIKPYDPIVYTLLVSTEHPLI